MPLSLLPIFAAAAAAACAAAFTVGDVKALTIPSNTFCVDLSPFVSGYRPAQGSPEITPPEYVVARVLDSLIATGRVRCVLTYGARGAPESVPRLAAARGLKVIQGLWLTNDPALNQQEIWAAEFLARNFPDTIVSVICGSELRFRYSKAVAEPIVANCVRQLRAAGITQPIGYQGTWPEFCDETYNPCGRWNAVSDIVDIVYLTVWAYWQNYQPSPFFPTCIPAQGAADYSIQQLQRVMSSHGDKLVVLSEFGWPGTPTPYVDPNVPFASCSVASIPNRNLVFSETMGKCGVNGYSCIIFESNQEPWKASIEGYVGPYWGFCSPDWPYACEFPPVWYFGGAHVTGCQDATGNCTTGSAPGLQGRDDGNSTPAAEAAPAADATAQPLAVATSGARAISGAAAAVAFGLLALGAAHWRAA